MKQSCSTYMKARVELVVAVIDTKSGAETSAVVIKNYAALSAGIVPHEAYSDHTPHCDRLSKSDD